jgi:hypothetical protein
MGVNLASLQSPPGPPGSPGRRSTPRGRVLFVNTSKSRDQSANMHKNATNKIQITTMPTLTGGS